MPKISLIEESDSSNFDEYTYTKTKLKPTQNKFV